MSKYTIVAAFGAALVLSACARQAPEPEPQPMPEPPPIVEDHSPGKGM
jgi:hypothetical protein